jgi:hypothetical protein
MPVHAPRERPIPRTAAGIIAALLLSLVLAVVASADGQGAAGTEGRCGPTSSRRVPQPSPARMAAAGLARLPVAPRRRRVDLVAPAFSDPTRVTNPLFPISRLRSVVLNGRVDGKPFRTETTLLPDRRVIEWSPRQCVRTLVSQYTAYLAGHIEEVALDYYAQGDDGSVWYFGEDVFNYRAGAVLSTDGTWLAGKEGPAAMIMPAHPRVGDVSRAENIPGLVWEEVSVKAVGETVAGPRGRVAGAMVGRELHDDGTWSDKVFAPGYGEFYSADRGDVEALALAVPTDARPGELPRSLTMIVREAYRASGAAAGARWTAAASSLARLQRAWAESSPSAPPRLGAPMRRGLAALEHAVDARDRRRAAQASLDVALAGLDLQLQYLTPASVDRARFDLWLRRCAVDARARAAGGLLGDVATLEWIRDRIARSFDPVALTRLDALLGELRAHADEQEFGVAARTARALRRLVRA